MMSNKLDEVRYWIYIRRSFGVRFTCARVANDDCDCLDDGRSPAEVADAGPFADVPLYAPASFRSHIALT